MKTIRLITPTLASWQHDCRKTAVINGWMVSFEPYASNGKVIARFSRKHRLVGDRMWARPVTEMVAPVP
jgi:hypothetical protein